MDILISDKEILRKGILSALKTRTFRNDKVLIQQEYIAFLNEYIPEYMGKKERKFKYINYKYVLKIVFIVEHFNTLLMVIDKELLYRDWQNSSKMPNNKYFRFYRPPSVSYCVFFFF